MNELHSIKGIQLSSCTRLPCINLQFSSGSFVNSEVMWLIFRKCEKRNQKDQSIEAHQSENEYMLPHEAV